MFWFVFFVAAVAGVYLLAFYAQRTITAESSFSQYLLEAAPALSAALALPAFFLLLRFCLNSPLFRPRPSRSQHILAAILVSLAAIITWKALQMYLQGTSFPFTGFAGALLGSLLFWLFWLLARGWLRNSNRRRPPEGL